MSRAAFRAVSKAVSKAASNATGIAAWATALLPLLYVAANLAPISEFVKVLTDGDNKEKDTSTYRKTKYDVLLVMTAIAAGVVTFGMLLQQRSPLAACAVLLLCSLLILTAVLSFDKLQNARPNSGTGTTMAIGSILFVIFFVPLLIGATIGSWFATGVSISNALGAPAWVRVLSPLAVLLVLWVLKVIPPATFVIVFITPDLEKSSLYPVANVLANGIVKLLAGKTSGVSSTKKSNNQTTTMRPKTSAPAAPRAPQKIM